MTNLQKSKRALKRVKTLIDASYDNYELNYLMQDIYKENIDTLIKSIEEQEVYTLYDKKYKV
mgnify:CR=1 FL=1|tara:strand:- start:379 stop:564 length:186 start_codon:yes stop_codon:yes gene_type:complete